MGDIRVIGLDTNIFMNVFREERGTESSAVLLEKIESGSMFGVASVLVLAEISTLFVTIHWAFPAIHLASFCLMR